MLLVCWHVHVVIYYRSNNKETPS